MLAIDDNTVVVTSAAELKTVVECNPVHDYSYVYFGADIELTESINICTSKLSLTLDGTYDNVTHTLTDIVNSTGSRNTLGLQSAPDSGSMQITLCNMNIFGHNPAGVPYIANNINTRGVEVIYRNVNYSGRGMTYNQRGLTRYIDCTIAMERIGNNVAFEVGNVNRLEIGGETTIIRNDLPNVSNTAFYFYRWTNDEASLTILPDADVTISTDFVFMRGNAASYTICKGASFKLTCNRGISFSATGASVGTFTVEENASFDYNQFDDSGARHIASLYIDSSLSVLNNARFSMQTDHNPQLIRFLTGNGDIILQSPKSFVLRKMQPFALAFSSSRSLSFTNGQINFWAETSTGTLSDWPRHHWHNPDYSDFEIIGLADDDKTIISSSTLVDYPGQPALDNLLLDKACVLSAGDLALTIDPVMTGGGPITGMTDPKANIQVVYTEETVTYQLTGTADDTGSFSIEPGSVPPSSGTSVAVTSNVPFLYRTESVVASGPLTITAAPEYIHFVKPYLSSTYRILRRGETASVTVLDERATFTKWELLAVIDGPLHTASGHELPGAIVFVGSKGDYSSMVPLVPDIPMSVYTGTVLQTTTQAWWDDDMGILVNLNAPLRLGETYTAKICWQVRPVE